MHTSTGLHATTLHRSQDFFGVQVSTTEERDAIRTRFDEMEEVNSFRDV